MGRRLPTLHRQGHALSAPQVQLAHLDAAAPRTFEASVGGEVRRKRTTTLQINVGRVCNQVCRHCHVDAGPDRRERMSDAVVEACLDRIEDGSFCTLDITGGAPEMHPRFRDIVRRATAAGATVMDRCNLTILDVPSYRDLPEFFAAHGVEVVASLPWYSAEATDRQRGDGVFGPSVAMLRRLNDVGYGRDPRLRLHLVTNPLGAALPRAQCGLECEWKTQLQAREGVVFNRLFVLNNLPVSRFLTDLVERGELQRYLDVLVQAFNPDAVGGLMCRDTLSVGYDGRLFDCDFNQMLDLSLPETIFELSPATLAGRRVRTAPHCFGCTAGSGSSCGGAIA
ncbi:MAG: arsenosugar biosynthesis radical SAM (seleno)protein ArsS [Myxococcota bacterium]